MPTAVAWYGNDVVFATTPSARRHEWDRSKESDAVISRHGVGGSLPVARVALADAPAAAHPVADTTFRPQTNPWVGYLGQPFVAMPRGIDRGTATRYRPAAIQ